MPTSSSFRQFHGMGHASHNVPPVEVLAVTSVACMLLRTCCKVLMISHTPAAFALGERRVVEVTLNFIAWLSSRT